MHIYLCIHVYVLLVLLSMLLKQFSSLGTIPAVDPVISMEGICRILYSYTKIMLGGQLWSPTQYSFQLLLVDISVYF